MTNTYKKLSVTTNIFGLLVLMTKGNTRIYFIINLLSIINLKHE